MPKMPRAAGNRQLAGDPHHLNTGRRVPQWRRRVLTAQDDRERLREIQQKVKLLADSLVLSSPPILALSEEVDRIVNRLMRMDSGRAD